MNRDIAADGQNLRPRSTNLSVKVKLMYGVGEISNSIKVVIFGLYSLFFATSVMRLPGAWIGAVGFFTMLWDAVIDPYIGYLTDGPFNRSRRFPFMLTGALVMSVGFWAFFSPPPGLSAAPLLGWLLIASLIVRTATSIYSIPYYAMGANLSEDYHERTSITAIRGITSIIGTSLAASLSFVVFFPEKTPGVDPKLQPGGYASMGLAFGLAMTLTALIALWGTLPLRRLTGDAAQAQQLPGSFFGGMRESLGNPSFRILLICSALSVIGLTVSSSLLLHYLTYYVKVNRSAALSSAQASFYACGLIGIIFWLRVAKNFEKHWLYVLSAAITSTLMLAGLPLFGEGHPLGTGDIRPLLIGYGAVGFFNCILWFMPQSMLADVVDESELLTGKRREGALFGMFSFVQQVASGVAILLAGGLLDRFIKLVPGKLAQSGVAIYRIGAVYSLVPGALFMAAAVLMIRYKLTRTRVESLQIALRQHRHQVQDTQAAALEPLKAVAGHF